jgi:hypothetical protein
MSLAQKAGQRQPTPLFWTHRIEKQLSVKGFLPRLLATPFSVRIGFFLAPFWF